MLSISCDPESRKSSRDFFSEGIKSPHISADKNKEYIGAIERQSVLDVINGSLDCADKRLTLEQTILFKYAENSALRNLAGTSGRHLH